MNTNTKKALACIYLLLILMQAFMPSVLAVELGQEYYLARDDRAFYSIQKINDQGNWVYITYEFVYYTDDSGNRQIAYCLDPELPGVGWAQGSVEGYSVILTDNVQNVSLGVNIEPTTEKGLQVWRACINGYPYKTANQLGVEEDEDAYLATKQAINCILRGYSLQDIRDNYQAGEWEIEGENLDDIQRRGNKVIDTMVNLVNIAYTSKETPANSDCIKINRINDLQKDIEPGYYTQEYSVTSSIDMEKYSVTFEGFPDGTVTTDLNGKVTAWFSENEHFKLRIPEDGLKENIYGTININTNSRTMPIFYGASTFDDYQNYAVCCSSYGNLGKSINVNFITNKGKINIEKIDVDSGVPIEDVTFELLQNGSAIKTAKTNSKGIACFDSLYPGKYTLREIETSSNYVLNEKEINVELEYKETANLEMTNEKKKGKIQIIKVDKNDNQVRIPGVTFEIVDEDGNQVETIITDKNGEAVTGMLPIDKEYTIKEIEAKEGYILNEEEKTIILEQDKIKTIIFENEKEKGKVKIIKVDADNSKIKIPGVIFEVLDLNGNVLETVTTNEEGEAVSSNYDIKDVEEVIIREIETAKNYELSKEERKVELKAGKVETITLTNAKKKLPKTGF